MASWPPNPSIPSESPNRDATRQLVPGKFLSAMKLPPFFEEDRLAVDAALELSRLPAVAVTETRSVRGSRMTNALDVVLRAGAIARLRLTEYNLRDAAVVLRPNVGSYGWADFQSIRKFVREGERVAENALRKIKSL